MKTIVIFILSTLFFVSTSFAQPKSNGYMGKRFIIMHNSFYFPAFKLPSFTRKYGIMNATKCLAVEYAATNRKTFCFAAQYVLTGVSYLTASGSPYGQYAVHNEGFTVPAQLSVMEYSIGLKKFKRNALAPIGFYLKWELMFLQYVIKYDNQGFYEYNYSYNYQSYVPADGGSGNIKLNGLGSAFSIGKQRIFWDKMVVNYGARFSLSVPFPYSLSNYVERSMVANAYDRILNHQLLNVTLGIGYLAF